jgi:DNA-binding transcriptional ArsR family regulator
MRKMATADQRERTTTMTPEEVPAADEEQESDAIPKDELFHILQNERRRRVLQYVVNRDGPFEMRAIAEQVAAWEHDTTVRQLTSDERQRVYIALYQSHLSKLDDAGLIEYQQSRGIVEVTDRIDVVKPHIDGTDEAEAADEPVGATGPVPFVSAEETASAGTQYYAGAALLSLALTGAVWTNVLPSPLLGQVGLTLVVIGIFTATAAAHLWQRQTADDE